MNKTVYTFSFILLVVIIGQALSSTQHHTIVLTPPDGELNLPEIPYDYSPELPLHVQDFILGWGGNGNSLSSIDDQIATLGRVLFYDKRLSDDNSLSCGSCHKQALAFSDDKALSNGIGENLTTRNTMPLNDLGWQVGQSFFWDFRSPNLEEAVLQPILATHELGKQMPDLIIKIDAEEAYWPLFTAAFGDQAVSEERIAVALAAFINSMVSFNTRYDQHMEGSITLTESEMAGQELFDNNCSFCHITPHFGVTDPFGFFPGGNNGLDSVYTDLGMGGWTGDDFLNGLFRAPSLRNTAVTAPYMHDGRFETLEDVIEFYSEEVIPNEQSMFNWIFGEDFTGYQFTDGEKIDLLAFLETLTDETLLTDERWSNPWQATVSTISTPALQGIKIYPNPTDDHLIIELDNVEKSLYNISMFDARGQVIKAIETIDERLTLERGKLPAGIYELRATTGQQQRTFKIIYK